MSLCVDCNRDDGARCCSAFGECVLSLLLPLMMMTPRVFICPLLLPLLRAGTWA
jgi:hypothetical protein